MKVVKMKYPMMFGDTSKDVVDVEFYIPSYKKSKELYNYDEKNKDEYEKIGYVKFHEKQIKPVVQSLLVDQSLLDKVWATFVDMDNTLVFTNWREGLIKVLNDAFRGSPAS